MLQFMQTGRGLVDFPAEGKHASASLGIGKATGKSTPIRGAEMGKEIKSPDTLK